MFVRQCLNEKCGYTIADPESKLDAWSGINCFKCRSSHMRYREATTFESIKVLFKRMDVYRPRRR